MKRILFMTIPIVIALLAFRPFVSSTSHTVSGTIKDDKGKAIVAATINVKGKTISAKTGGDGSYTITATDKNDVLVFSAIGFKSKEIKIEGKTTIDVVLSANKVVVNKPKGGPIVVRGPVDYEKNAGDVAAVAPYRANQFGT
jgi:hypothetical protein